MLFDIRFIPQNGVIVPEYYTKNRDNRGYAVIINDAFYDSVGLERASSVVTV